MRVAILVSIFILSFYNPAVTFFSGGVEIGTTNLLSDGSSTTILSLKPNESSVINISLPAKAKITSGTFMLQPFEKEFPRGLKLDLGNDGTTDFEFGKELGDYGRQYLIDGKESSELFINEKGARFCITLPEKANVKSASLQLRPIGKSWGFLEWKERINLELGGDFRDEVLEIWLDLSFANVVDAVNELRVVHYDSSTDAESEVPMQVINERKNETKSFEATVLFKAKENGTYFIYMSNPNAKQTDNWMDFNPQIFKLRGQKAPIEGDNYVFSNPYDIAIGSNIYLADRGNHRIQIFTFDGLAIGTIGKAREMGSDNKKFSYPSGIGIGEHIYVADSSNQRIQVFGFDGGYIRTVGITGEIGADNSHFNYPKDAGVWNDRLYIADTNNHRVQILDLNGSYIGTIGKTGQSGNDNEHLSYPYSIATDSSGNVYVADTSNHRVQIFDSSGTYKLTIGISGEFGNDNSHFNYPHGVGIDNIEKRIYVGDTGNHRVQVFDMDGKYISTIGISGERGSDFRHLDRPYGVDVDPSGNLYVVDQGNQRIQVFDIAGNYMTTIGIKSQPKIGEKEFYYVHSVAVGKERIIVGDAGNHRIQIFDNLMNYIQTLGVDGQIGTDNEHFYSPRGVVIGKLNGEDVICIADTYNHRVQLFDILGYHIRTLGITGQSGKDAFHFNSPRGVAVIDNRIYVGDTKNHRVQIFDSFGNYINTIGVSGESGSDNIHFNNPYGIAVDEDSYLYVADSSNNRIQIFNSTYSYKHTIIGLLNNPRGVAVEKEGNVKKIYIADSYNHIIKIYKYEKDNTSLIGTIGAGKTGKDNEHFNYPYGIALGDGKIFVADTDNHRVQIFDKFGRYSTTLGKYKYEQPTNFYLYSPRGIAVDSQSNIYIADTNNERVQIFSKFGTYISTIGTPGIGGDTKDKFNGPHGLGVGKDKLYVADKNNHRIQIFDLSGMYIKTLGITGQSGTDNFHFNGPHDVAVDKSGNIYVADKGNHRIQIFDENENYLRTIGVPGESGTDNFHLNDPRSLDIGDDGTIYVSDTENHRIQIFDSSGSYIRTIGISGISGNDNFHLNSPYGISVSDGKIYVADYNNHRIQVFDEDGKYIHTIGIACEIGSDGNHFNYPYDVKAIYGNLFIVDRDNHRVVIVKKADLISSKLEKQSFPKELKIDVGCDGTIDWRYAGLLTKETTATNFADKVSKVLESKNTTFERFGLHFIEVEVCITASEPSLVLIHNLSIIYEQRVFIDLTEAFNNYLSKAESGIVEVPIAIESKNKAKIVISDIWITWEIKREIKKSFIFPTFFEIYIIISVLICLGAIIIIYGAYKEKKRKEIEEAPAPVIKPAGEFKPEVKPIEAEIKPKMKPKIVPLEPEERPYWVDVVTRTESLRIKEPPDTKKRGTSYLILEEKTSTAISIFKTYSATMSGLVLTTSFPKKLRDKLQTKAEIIWLTNTTTTEKTLNPTTIEYEMLQTILKFGRENRRAVIMIDDLGYLSIVNGFDNVVKFVKNLCDMVTTTTVNLVISITPMAYDEKELSVLVRNFDNVQIGDAKQRTISELKPLEIFPSHAYAVKKGSSYVYEFLKVMSSLRKIMCVTTTPPKRINEMYGLSSESILWLSDTQEKGAIAPTKLNFEVQQSIAKFLLNNPGSIVFLDGIEHLVLYNGFNEVVKFIKTICDISAEQKCAVLFSIDQKAFALKEISMLESRADIVVV
ncbi:MAG: DUF835 domain-containing protein [Candidatus Thermoplasmatota archaeon]